MPASGLVQVNGVFRVAQYRRGSTMRFSAELLPIDGLQAAWFLDGAPLESAHGAALDLVLDSPVRSKHRLQLRVTDRSGTFTADDGSPPVRTRTWKIRVAPAVGEKPRSASSAP